MKAKTVLLIAAMVLFTACEEKPSGASNTIYGRWQVYDIFVETGHGVYHEELDEVTLFDFLPSNELVTTVISNGDTVCDSNCSWLLYNDTLIMYQNHAPGEEPNMPGVMQIQTLNSKRMRWCNLVLGDLYVDLIRGGI